MNDLIDQLMEHEGSIAYVYQDSLGYWTIGCGRLVDKRKGGKLSDDEIRMLLKNDIERVKLELDRALPWWRALDSIRQRVLVDMAFNLGIAGLLKFTRTLALIKAGVYTGAADAMLKSKWSRQVGQRAVRLAQMMKTGLAPKRTVLSISRK